MVVRTAALLRTARRARATAAADPRPRVVQACDVASRPWRNGGGAARDLLRLPDAHNWQLCVSLADITADGAFSAYPGTRRWFAVVEGAGVRLCLPTGERVVRRGDAPLEFDGVDAPLCHRLDGPTKALNLMTRHGCRGALCTADPGVAWHEPFTGRGLFTTVAGTWRSGDGPPRALTAFSLVWLDSSAPQSFEPAAREDAGRVGWWIGGWIDCAPAGGA